MKINTKKSCFILVIVMSLVAAQGVRAETFEVEGVIISISVRPNSALPNMVLLDNETEVYSVRFKYLNKKYDINLSPDDFVKFMVYEYECSDGSTRLRACEIAVEEYNNYEWILLRDCPQS